MKTKPKLEDICQKLNQDNRIYEDNIPLCPIFTGSYIGCKYQGIIEDSVKVPVILSNKIITLYYRKCHNPNDQKKYQ